MQENNTPANHDGISEEAILSDSTSHLVTKTLSALDNTEDWESGTYGEDERYVARAPAELEAQVSAALGLQPKSQGD